MALSGSEKQIQKPHLAEALLAAAHGAAPHRGSNVTGEEDAICF